MTYAEVNGGKLLPRALMCGACAPPVYSKADSPRAFCVSNGSHAAVACTRGIRADGCIRPISDQ